MLVLTRRVEEAIVIGDDIRVTVLAVQGRTVRLGFTAPRSVRVMRVELCGEPAGRTDGPADDEAANGRRD